MVVGLLKQPTTQKGQPRIMSASVQDTSPPTSTVRLRLADPDRGGRHRHLRGVTPPEHRAAHLVQLHKAAK